jgi:hypothetical protein
MAPSVLEAVQDIPVQVKKNLSKSVTRNSAPLELSGALDKYESFDVTPVIGREFRGVDLAEWLRAPNSDELIRDLAITGNDLESSSLPNAADFVSFPARCRLLPRPGQHQQ